MISRSSPLSPGEAAADGSQAAHDAREGADHQASGDHRGWHRDAGGDILRHAEGEDRCAAGCLCSDGPDGGGEIQVEELKERKKKQLIWLNLHLQPSAPPPPQYYMFEYSRCFFCCSSWCRIPILEGRLVNQQKEKDILPNVLEMLQFLQCKS